MRRGAVFIAALAIAALVAFLAAASIKDSVSPSALAGDVRTLTWALYRMEDGRSGMVKLPHVFNNLPPRSKVELWLNLDSNPGDSILIKTFYSELRVYADDELLFRRGDDGSYPSFLNDPPTELTMTQLPEKTRQLRLEYASPTQRGRVEAQPIFIGSDLSLYSRQFRTDIVSLIFSLLLLLFAIFVILLTFFLMTGLAEARSILWLGLLCLSGAVWGVGECDAMLFLIPYPALMYLMAFCGLYFIPIPFLMYVSSVVRPVIQWPFRAMLAVHAACLAYVLAAQAAGRADLSSFTPRFHFLILFPFAVSFLIMILEHKKYATKLAARFAVSTLLLASFIVLEIINYRVRFTNMLGLFFNAGLLAFLFDLGLIRGRRIKEYIAATREKNRLEAEMGFISIMLDTRREQYAKMMEASRRAAAARHDLRHQLAVIKGYSDAADWRGLNAFLGDIAENIKPSPPPVCENFAVSAVAERYISVARDSGVAIDVRLGIPQRVERVNDLDLCVIVGNLLENAVEACLRTNGERFIRVIGRSLNGTLAIVIENSFDGRWKKRGGAYLSMKRPPDAGQEPRPGVGISSVREICRKYDGLLKFDVEGNVWCASAVLDLTGRLSGRE